MVSNPHWSFRDVQNFLCINKWKSLKLPPHFTKHILRGLGTWVFWVLRDHFWHSETLLVLNNHYKEFHFYWFIYYVDEATFCYRNMNEWKLKNFQGYACVFLEFWCAFIEFPYNIFWISTFRYFIIINNCFKWRSSVFDDSSNIFQFK